MDNARAANGLIFRYASWNLLYQRHKTFQFIGNHRSCHRHSCIWLNLSRKGFLLAKLGPTCSPSFRWRATPTTAGRPSWRISGRTLECRKAATWCLPWLIWMLVWQLLVSFARRTRFSSRPLQITGTNVILWHYTILPVLFVLSTFTLTINDVQ